MGRTALIFVLLMLSNAALGASHHPSKHIRQQAGHLKPHFRCFTNQPNCSGQAEWISGGVESCRIYWVYGGESNWVMYRAGETAYYWVQYGDTYACVWGSSGVPNTAPRYYIGVN